MKRIANIRLTKRTEQGMRMCTLLLFFFIFIEIIKRDVVVWRIPAIQKENLEWSLKKTLAIGIPMFGERWCFAVAEYRNRRKQEERIKAVENGRRV